MVGGWRPGHGFRQSRLQSDMRSKVTVTFICESPASGDRDGFAGAPVTPVPATKVNPLPPPVMRPEKVNCFVTESSDPKPEADKVCVLKRIWQEVKSITSLLLGRAHCRDGIGPLVLAPMKAETFWPKGACCKVRVNCPLTVTR